MTFRLDNQVNHTSTETSSALRDNMFESIRGPEQLDSRRDLGDNTVVAFPIVRVTTTDGYILHGLLSEPHSPSRVLILHVHGSAGDFYQSGFTPHLFALAERLGIGILTTNNRGTGVYDVEKGTKSRGAALEIFEDCLLDIDAWIAFATSRGYESIILSGHSFGTNKIQHYVREGQKRDAVRALVLLGFTDSYGGQLEYLEHAGLTNEALLAEADHMIAEGRPDELLPFGPVNWGELPQTAASYRNFMSPGSVLSGVLPLRDRRKLEKFSRMNLPIVGIVGDHGECTVIPPPEAAALLKSSNPQATVHVIPDSDHSYTGKEQELVSILERFFSNVIRDFS